jgi:hypothetical protein
MARPVFTPGAEREIPITGEKARVLASCVWEAAICSSVGCWPKAGKEGMAGSDPWALSGRGRSDAENPRVPIPPPA